MLSRRKFIYYLIVLLSINNNPVRTYATEYIKLVKGEVAPNFKLEAINVDATDTELWELSDNRGKWIVLYFYPKDYTNGCTIEARGFKELNHEFNRENALVFGVSSDSVEQHKSFCNDESLGFTLLSDY